MSGKCPKCEKLMSYTNYEAMDTKSAYGAYKGVAYKCPFCFTIIGFQMDPLALKADIVAAIKGR